MEEMRLQKYIAMCGVASRRKAEELITEGRVSVNGLKVTELGTKVNEGDVVKVDEKIIQPESRKIYIALNKPKEVITASSDDRGRITVIDLVSEEIKERIYPTGRLDYDTEGLILLTNDGEVADLLMHPKNEVVKTYVAGVSKVPQIKDIEQLRRGVFIDDRKTSPAEVDWINDKVLKISIHEGRNRQVRKMCEAVGLKVKELKRISIGNILLGNIPLGRWRHLTKAEITYLKNLKAR